MTDAIEQDEMTDEIVLEDGATVTTDWTADDVADEIGTTGKRLRAWLRARNRAAGLPTPGAGGQWAIPVPVDDAMREAFFDALTEAFRAGGRSDRKVTFTLEA